MSTSLSKRIVRVPLGAGLNAQRVLSEVLNSLQSLKTAGTTIFVTQSDMIPGLAYTYQIVQLEALLSSANDTTFQGNFASWASLLGIASMDTEVATFTQG